MNQTAIVGFGIATPCYTRTQKETAELVSERLQLTPAKKRLLLSIYKATGIEFRHSVLADYAKDATKFDFFPNESNAAFPTTAKRMKIYKDNAFNLALVAIRNCLASLNTFIASEITHVITVSCTGMYAPGIDIEIVKELELNSNTKRLTINFMGCYGAFNAIKVADAICKADVTAKVLVVCVELCTIHFSPNSSIDNLISNSIFSDGAAAVLIQSKPQSGKHISLEHFHCDLIPNSDNEMAWQIADSGFDIVLSSYVPRTISSGIFAFMQRILSQSSLTFNNVDFYAIHPGGIKILQACEEALNITKHDNRYSYSTLKNYGNMSSATILFVLKNLWDDLQPLDNQKNIFSCAFGPGLTLESMLLKIHCA